MKMVSLALTLSMALLSGGCCIGKKSEEERLNEMVLRNRVYAYMGAKSMLSASFRGKSAADPGSKLSNKLLSVVNGSGQLSPQDSVDLLKAAWELRGEMKEHVKNRDAMKPAPILANHTPADAAVEHGFLAGVLQISKFHPQSPVPVQPHWILYEAATTRPQDAPQGVRPVLEAARSVAFSLNDLCAMGSASAAPFTGDKLALEAALFQKDMTAAGWNPGSDIREIDGLLKVVVNGAAITCKLKDTSTDGLTPHLQGLIHGAAQLGLKSSETEFFKAYLSCFSGDAAAGKATLQGLRGARDLSKDLQKSMDDLSAHCSDGSGKLAKAIDHGFFFKTALRLAYDKASQSRALDDLWNSKKAKQLRNFGQGTVDMLKEGAKNIPGLGE